MKLLTEFDGHPKVFEVGLSGAGLYARSLAYSGKYETDGVIPKAWVLHTVAHEGLDDLPTRLVEAGLWTRHETGYEIRDFTEVNRSKAEMDSLRESRSIAGKKGGGSKRQAKRKQKRSKPPSSSNSSSKSFSSEFEEWLEHFQNTTEKDGFKGSETARKAFASRRREGKTLDELKLATVGCHGDEWLRQNGYNVPDTILRAKNVARYIELGRATSPRNPSKYEGKEKVVHV